MLAREDDFFELGGDSLLAVWLMEEVAKETGRDLPLSLLLKVRPSGI